MDSSAPQTFERYLALDVHKHYLVVGGVNAAKEVILPARRLYWDEWATWAPKHLRRTDALVLEATGNTWHVYDEVSRLVGRAVVAPPARSKGLLMPASRPTRWRSSIWHACWRWT